MKRRLLLVLVALLLPATGTAQTPLGAVAGTVLDQIGGGAARGNSHAHEHRDRAGEDRNQRRHRRVPLPAGAGRQLQGEVTLEGFKTAEFTDVKVNVGQEYR